MSERWWKKYLENVSEKKMVRLFKKEGFADPQAAYEWIIEEAALCRLSFVSLIDTNERALSFGISKEAIISCTKIGMSKGRPQTARWAFWAGYLFERELAGQDTSFSFFADLVAMLLGSKVIPIKVEIIFSKLRKEAEEHATEFANLFFSNNLKPELSERQFEKYLKTYLGEDLAPDTSMPPMIGNGKLNQNWVQDVLKIRKDIISRIRKHGLLDGQKPIIRTSSLTKFATNIPLNPYNPPIGNSSSEAGKIHLDKAMQVLIPSPVLAQGKSVVSFSFNGDENGGITSIGFPQHALDTQDPFAAVLYSVPAWWYEWRDIFVALS